METITISKSEYDTLKELEKRVGFFQEEISEVFESSKELNEDFVNESLQNKERKGQEFENIEELENYLKNEI
jgi:hypothetical protein